MANTTGDNMSETPCEARLQKQQGTGLLPLVLQYFLLGSSATPQEENGSGFVIL